MSADDTYNPIPAEYTAAVGPPSYAPPPPPPGEGAYTGPGSIYWGQGNSTPPSNPEPSTIQVSQVATEVQGAAPANTSSMDWGNLFTGVGRGLINIFGQKVGGQPPVAPPPPSPSIPVWVWVAVPVVAIGLLAVLIRSGRPAAVAGYRRKSRKSRR